MSKSDKVSLESYNRTVTGTEFGTLGPQKVSDVAPPINFVNSVLYGPNVPGYRERLAHGDSATTVLESRRLHFGRGVYGSSITITGADPLTYTSFRGGVYTGGWPGVFGPAAVTTAVDAEADKIATSRLLKSIIDSRRKFYGASFIAEFRETVESFMHPFRTFYKGSYDISMKLRHIYKADAGRRDVFRKMGDAWLGWKFAVAPTVNDLNELSDAVNGGFHTTQTLPIKGFGRRTDMSVTPNRVLGLPSWYARPSICCTQVSKTDFTVRYKGALRNEPNANVNLQRFGLDSIDLPGGVWEGTPWSWLVDYFLNVGEMIDAMRLWTMSPAWLNRTVRNANTINASDYYVQKEHDRKFFFVSGPKYYSLATYTLRQPKLDIPSPQFHFQLPSFMQGLNLAAVGQSFRKLEEAISIGRLKGPRR